MKTHSAAILIALLLVALPIEAAERIKTAVLPAVSGIEKPPKDWEPKDYFIDDILIGLNKVERFEVLDGGDVRAALQEKGIVVDRLTEAKGAEIAKLLGARLVLLPKVDSLTIEKKTEELLIIEKQSVVCRASVSGTLYDAETGKLVELGPYPFEEKKMGSGGNKAFELKPEDAMELAQKCIAAGAKNLRSRIYKLYPLAGRIASVADDAVVIDVGRNMGVEPGDTFAVFGMVEEESLVTGLKEKVRREVARLSVDKVDEKSSACRVLRGEKEHVKADATVVQVFE